MIGMAHSAHDPEPTKAAGSICMQRTVSMRRQMAPVPQETVRRLRKGRPRRRACAKVLADSDVCWLCGHEGADTVDEVIPLSYGGSPVDPDNLRPAHGVAGCPTCKRKCNQQRGNRMITAPPLATSRRW